MDLNSIYGKVLFSAAVETVRELVVAAVKAKVSLQGANLQEADLQGAYLQDANLRGANLYRANLEGADLRRADLEEANLEEANLEEAYLQWADLRGANLEGAKLRRAYLQRAYLRGAYLRRAYLQGAYLQDANLRGANLEEAYLQGADLEEADLEGAKEIPELAAAQTTILPEGSCIGWKKCQNDVIVKLLIPAQAHKSNATGRKCRAEFVQVLQVFGAEVGVSTYDYVTQYRKGETVTCKSWEEDRWKECGGGIHFFISRIEAEKY